MMRQVAPIALLVLTTPQAALPSGPIGKAPIADKPQPCAPPEGLRFVCGTGAAEEIAPLPGERWLVASELNLGRPARLHAIDRVAKTAHALDVAMSAPDPATGCSSPPDTTRWSLDGLSLGPAHQGGHLLYVANHGDRNAVEIMVATVSRQGPTLRWIGCVPMPVHTLANAVAATPDGFFVTSFHDPADRQAFAKLDRRAPVSSVWRWRWRGKMTPVPIGPLSGANGIAFDQVRQRLYVSNWAAKALATLDLPSDKIGRIPLDFMPDNLHLDPAGTGVLWIGGQQSTPARIGACGVQCPQPWVVVRRTPGRRPAVVVRGAGSVTVNYICGALPMGDTLWMTLRGADRLAWKPLSR